MHRCEYILDDYDRIFEERDLCGHRAWHYYQPWRQWFCGYHRQYLCDLHGVRKHDWHLCYTIPKRSIWLRWLTHLLFYSA